MKTKVEHRIIFDKQKEVEVFFKNLLELPDAFGYYTEAGHTTIRFKKIDKVKLYKKLLKWLGKRI